MQNSRSVAIILIHINFFIFSLHNNFRVYKSLFNLIARCCKARFCIAWVVFKTCA